MFPAFACECKNKFGRRDNLFQHMRAKGCVVWYKDGVRQNDPVDDIKSSEDAEDAEDRYVKQVIEDAQKAKDKRERAFKQAWSRS